MRITTWNVNGLRAILKKNFLADLDTLNSDILCLQEIKGRPEQLEPESLQTIQNRYTELAWNPAQRPGYSGVSTWARIKPDELTCSLGIEDFDNQGRMIASRYGDLWLFNIYFPNGGYDQSRVPYKLEFYACVLELVDRLQAQGQFVVITGDFNISHQEIDLAHPKANENATGFLPEERAWIDRYLSHGLVDGFRQLYPDKVEYTWWAYFTKSRERNVGWRLDYYLVSAALMPRVVDVINHTSFLGSDHCPVTLVLKD